MRAARVTVFRGEYTVQAYRCDGEGALRASFMASSSPERGGGTPSLVSRREEGQSQASHRLSTRTGHKTGLRVTGIPDPEGQCRPPTSPWGGTKTRGPQILHTLSKNTLSFPSPAWALLPPPPAARARRPQLSTPEPRSLGPALPGPEHAPRGPELSPQAGGFPRAPAAPHLPAARSLPSSRSPARPPLTSHLRAGRSRRRPSLSRARRPALSLTGLSHGGAAPAGHRRAHAAMFVQGAALPAHTGEGRVCAERSGSAEERERTLLTISGRRQRREWPQHGSDTSRGAPSAQSITALLKDGHAGFAPLQDGGAAAPPRGGGAAAAGVSLRRARGRQRGAMLALVARAAVRATPAGAAPPGQAGDGAQGGGRAGPCTGPGIGVAGGEPGTVRGLYPGQGVRWFPAVPPPSGAGRDPAEVSSPGLLVSSRAWQR